jgi:heme-degrading monooxygenase HmoA
VDESAHRSIRSIDRRFCSAASTPRERRSPSRCTLAGMYVIVWQFVPKAGCEAEFERAYGSQGRWAELFRSGDGYHGTELWRGDGVWLTVDRWQSEQHYERFRRERQKDYEAIDREMERLTDRETRIGMFTLV